MSRIHAIVFSYKGKETLKCLQSLQNNTNSSISITLIDKNPLKRDKKFNEIQNFRYFHDFWDFQVSPIKLKHDRLLESSSDYALVMTDDVVVSEGWDTKIIAMADRHVVSGSGKLEIDQSDKFFIKRSYTSSDDFTLTNFIDKNFIFAKSEMLKSIPFPADLKYHGEDEMLSINMFIRGIDVYSAPSGTYEDLRYRTLENLFAPFSIEHGYNSFVDLVKNKNLHLRDDLKGPRSITDFLNFHKINTDILFRLPLQNDDVPYSPYSMKMDDHDSMGGRRFTDNIKVVN